MHILHVSPYYPPTWAYGGIPRIVFGLTQAQKHLGHDVSVLTTDVLDKHMRNRQPILRQEQGINVINLPNLSNTLAYRQLFLPLKSHTINHIPKPDIIHLHGHRHLLNNIAVSYAQKHNIPYVLTANGTLHRHERWIGIKRIWDRVFSEHIPKNAQKCIAVSPADIHIHQQCGIKRENIIHIPNGLDLGEFSSLPPPRTFRKKWKLDDRPIVTYLGQLSQRKGIEHLIQACLPLDNIYLVIAGNDMGMYPQLKKLAANHQHIIFTGLLRGDERLELLRDTAVLCYPSTNEIFGLSPFEGLLCGAPAIVCDDCGCGQLISKAQAGLLIPYAQPKTLQRSIIQLIADTQLRNVMVKRGRTYIHEHLSFRHIAQKHLDVYHMILREQPS